MPHHPTQSYDNKTRGRQTSASPDKCKGKYKDTLSYAGSKKPKRVTAEKIGRGKNSDADQGKRKNGGDKTGVYPGRYAFIFLLLALIIVAIIAKLLYIQVIDAERLKRKAQQSRNQALSLYNRGRILDKNGVILAQDTLLYDIYAHRQYFSDLTPKQIAAAISPALKIPVDRLVTRLSMNVDTVSVKKNVSKDVIEKLREIRVPLLAKDPKTSKPLYDETTGEPIYKHVRISGLDYAKKPVRNYPQGTLAAHVLGYANDEADVSAGIEETAKEILKKAPPDVGKAILSGRGDVIQPENLLPEHLVNVPKAEDVVLTIDSRLQYLAERELALGLKRTKAKRGTVIMMDPKTGEMLAFASLPNYAPDKFYKASAEELKNWAITDVYPPGSTFKILTMACGLETGVITPKSKILDTGKMKVGGWTIQNYDYGKRGAPGMIDLTYLLIHSSNIASAKISLLIPKKKHFDLLKGFGMGEKTKIDLSGESSGIMHAPSTWDESTHASLGYGYGLAATPMQMAAAIAAIANGGIWTTPHVIQNQKNIQTRRVLSEKTSAQMTQLLAKSIREAKTSSVRLEGVEVAGKTGTSRKPKANGRGYENNVYTSFVGYYPAENPKALVMVVIDSPGIGEAWGSTVAGPIFKAIAQESIGYLGLKPAKMESTTEVSTSQKPLQSAAH
ncbi:MAG: penicillin-binding protein 2 [Vampirovibrionales bacterium]|nr:penicillin-binding protein 2 [Vampirovibrionales bacterium]